LGRSPALPSLCCINIVPYTLGDYTIYTK